MYVDYIINECYNSSIQVKILYVNDLFEYISFLQKKFSIITYVKKGRNDMMSKNDTRAMRGPLQIVHDFKFTALNVNDNYSSLERMRQEEKITHIKARIDRLHRIGYGGVVMNVDYKEYLKNPDAFKVFFECAKYAKTLGMYVPVFSPVLQTMVQAIIATALRYIHSPATASQMGSHPGY